MSSWILQSAKTIGRDHIRSNTVCQDDVKTLQKDGVSVIALSDGCGSAPLSEYGASATVDCLCNVLTDNFDEIFNMDELDIKKYIHSKLIEKLTECVVGNKGLVQSFKKDNPEHFENFLDNWPGFDKAESVYPLTLFDATVQFVATKNGKTIIGRLGDGFIGDVVDKQLRLLSSEDKNGRKNNETIYPSTILLALTRLIDPEKAWKYFEVLKRDDDETEMYFIVSDGMGDILIDDEAKDEQEKQEEFKPLDSPRLYFNDKLIEEILIEKDLNQYLEYSNRAKPEFKVTGDDLSIAILRKPKVEFDKRIIREYDENQNTIANNKVAAIDRLISIEYVPQNEKIYTEEVVLDEYPSIYEYKNLLDDKQVEYIRSLCGDEEGKLEYIIGNLSIIKEELADKKTILFDEALQILSPYVEEVDLVMLLQYAILIKLLQYDVQSREISLFGKE